MSFVDVQQFLTANGLDAWLAYDFRGSNPYFLEVMGRYHTTRRVFLLVPAAGQPVLLVHFVDAGRFPEGEVAKEVYLSRQELASKLQAHLQGCRRVAMEYSPGGALPAASFTDGGTLEMVRDLGVEVVSSANLFQHGFARWSAADLAAHRRAALALVASMRRAFAFVGANLGQATEMSTVEFLRQELARAGLQTEDGPVVAVGAHSGDPHYEPLPASNRPINSGDWVLIDLWAGEPGQVYADITWVGYAGRTVPARYQEVFAIVAGAREAAFARLAEAFRQGHTLEGWQVDQVARDYIGQRGYGQYFTHRLGHSLGRRVHAHGANLDNLETQDSRQLVPGLGFTIEPGIYLPEFGVRTEVDAYLGEEGPVMTTEAQHEVVLI